MHGAIIVLDMWSKMTGEGEEEGNLQLIDLSATPQVKSICTDNVGFSWDKWVLHKRFLVYNHHYKLSGSLPFIAFLICLMFLIFDPDCRSYIAKI